MTKYLIALAAVGMLAVACNKTEAPAGDKPADKKADAPAAGAGKTGLPECDKAVEAMKKCAEKAGPAKDGMLQGAKALEDATISGLKAGEAAKPALKTSCETQLKALEGNPVCK
jgi:hypothetical protein